MEFDYLEGPVNAAMDTLQLQSQINEVQPNTVEIPETQEVKEVPRLEQAVDWNPDIRFDVPGVGAAAVTGNPYEIAPLLDSHQGDTGLRAAGTCGLTSIANVCVMAGMEVTEADVVDFAIDKDLCTHGFWKSEGDRGGTTIEERLEVLKAYGIDATGYNAVDEGGSLENIADAVEDGKGVILGLNAGLLWDEPSCVGGAYGITPSNHCVTVTGVARDANNGEVAGFYICDSGRCLDTDACRYLSVDELSEAYNENIYNANVVITDQPIRNN